MRKATPIIGLVAAIVLAASGAQAATQADPGRGSKPKWRLVFNEKFSKAIDESVWGLYEGQPGGDPGGWWDPSHVVVKGGVAHLQTYRDPRFDNRWVSGGMTNSHALKQTYGKYLVRFRATKGYGVSNILLLWPVADHWPPEIDFAEDGGTSSTGRPAVSASFHYGEDNDQIQRDLTGDFTKWHVLGVEWTPGRLVYTIDGKTWGTVLSPFVPDEPMELAIQAQAGTCGDEWAPCPNETTPALVDLQVDWVQAYSYGPPQ